MNVTDTKPEWAALLLLSLAAAPVLWGAAGGRTPLLLPSLDSSSVFDASSWSYAASGPLGGFYAARQGSNGGWPDALRSRRAELERCGLGPEDIVDASLDRRPLPGPWRVTRMDGDTSADRWDCVGAILASLHLADLPSGTRRVRIQARMADPHPRPNRSLATVQLTCVSRQGLGLTDCLPSRSAGLTTSGTMTLPRAAAQVELLRCADPGVAMTRLRAAWVDGALTSVHTLPEAPCVEARLAAHGNALELWEGRTASDFTRASLTADVPLGGGR